MVLVKAGLEAEAYLITTVALVASLLTIYSMTKLWNEAFWKPRPADAAGIPVEPASLAGTLLGPVVALTALTIAMGLGAGPVFELASRAAAQLSDPSQYIAAVLGPGGLR
jgi:multicomponent Na+:H+ antiporter subunit D